MKKALVAVLLACISVFCSCNKFSIGNDKVVTLTANGDFQVIEFRDDVNVTLLHSDASHPAGEITIKAGENLIDNISAEVQESDDAIDGIRLNKLVISNNNSLSFLHSYDYSIEMTVYYDSLYHLIFNSNARDITTDSLKGFDYPTHFTQDTIEWDSLAPNLLIEIEGGSGTFNVKTDCYRVTTKFIHGTSSINIEGTSSIASTYADYDCHGIIDSRDMESHIHYVTSYGTNKIYAKAFSQLKASNFNIGLIYYIEYDKETLDFIPPDDEHPYGQQLWVTHHCPMIKELYGSNILPLKE